MTKPEIALEQLRWACEAGLPRGVILADSAYGSDGKFRTGITALGLTYVASIQAQALVWLPGSSRKPTRATPPKNRRRDEGDLVSVKELALGLSKKAWRTIKWREGSAERLSSRFARLRVYVGHRHQPPEYRSEEWLLIEWPEGEQEPTNYWLSTLPEDISFDRLVDLTKLRWRIERDYQELKQEVGLGHYEGRRWRGFHHHATLWIVSYGIPDLRAGDDSPFRTSFHRAVQDACATRRLSTQRSRRCGLNVTSRTRSQPCAGD